MSRALRQQRALGEVIESISAELELRPLLTRIIRHACELLSADDGAIGLYEPRRERIRIEAVCHMPEDELGAEFAAGVGLAGQVLATRRPVVAAAYGQLPRPTRGDRDDHAVLGVPIEWRGELVGFFGLGAAPPRRFDAEDVEALRLFARHAAIAIDNAQRYLQQREAGRRWQLVARLGRLSSTGLELDLLLGSAVEAISDVLDYASTEVFLVAEQDPGMLERRAIAGRSGSAEAATKLPLGCGLAGLAAAQRTAQRLTEVPALGSGTVTGPSLRRVRVAMPIVHGELLGVLEIAHDGPMGEEEVAGLEVVAGYLAVAIDNARLYRRGRNLAALEERHRIARELHDSVSQQIFSISLQAQAVAAAWRRDPAEGEAVVDTLVRSCRAAQQEMRALLQELRPPGERSLEESTRELSLPPLLRVRRQGLPATLGQYLDQAAPEGVDVTVDAMAYRPQPVEVEEALFRIAQEALHNVFKHARARRARVRLMAGQGVVLEVSDDGIGLGGPGVRGSGLGLLSMRERAKAQGGIFELHSRPGEGTTVRVTLPAREGAPWASG